MALVNGNLIYKQTIFKVGSSSLSITVRAVSQKKINWEDLVHRKLILGNDWASNWINKRNKEKGLSS